MTEWKEYKLRDLFKSTKSGDWGKDSPEGNYVEEVTCLRGADIPATNLQEINKAPTRYISEKNFSERRLSVGDLMIEMSGGSPTQSTGRIAYISQNILDLYNSRLICSNFCKVLQVNSNLIDSSFTYYLWVYLYNKRLFFSYENGTNGLKNLFLDAVLDYESVTIPKDLYEQKKIALQLSEIDDKIAVNRKICRNLEAQAQALFKHWFVDFAPFKEGKFVESELGLIPEGWRVGNLFDIASIFDKIRKPLSGKDREYMNKIYPYYGATSCMDYVDNYLFDGIYTLIGEDGSVAKEDGLPYMQYVWGKFWVNNHAHILQGKNGFSTEMVHVFLSRYNIKHLVTGAVQAKLSQANMQKIMLPIPPKDEINKIRPVIDSLYEKIRNCEEESLRLSTLRDTLLPKLMSGQIKL